MKKRYLTVLLLVLGALLIVLGSTYAYFNVINPSNKSDVTVETKLLRIRYIDGPELVLTGIIPGNKIVKTFSVENTGTETASYALKFIDVVNELIGTNDLVYELIGSNGVNISNVTYPVRESMLNSYVSIEPDEVDEYTLTISYLNRGYDQSIDMDKMIAGTINIGEVPQVRFKSLSMAMIPTIDEEIEEYEGLVGEGTSEVPYLISDALDLIYFNNKANANEEIIGLTPSRTLNNHDEPALSSYYELTSDIILNDPETQNLWSEGSEDYYNWLGIGTSENPFTGTIDGNYHLIKGISNITSGESSGLINYGRDLTIKNLEISDSTFSASTYAAGFAGYVTSSDGGLVEFTNLINNATVNATASGSWSSSYSAGILAYYYYFSSTGGATLNITDCINNATINGIADYSNSSGVVAYINNYTTDTNINISRNINNGNITGYDVAGIIAYIGTKNGSADSPDSIINNNINNGIITASDSASGIVDQAYNAHVVMYYNTNYGVVTGSTASGILGYNSTKADMEYSINNGNISGTTSNAAGIVRYVSNGPLTMKNCYNSGTITGLVNTSGLVAQVGQSGVSTISKSYNIGAVNATGTGGGIIGRSSDGGRINVDQVYNSGIITCTYSSNSYNYCGGIFGASSFGTWKNIYNTGNVIGSTDSAGIISLIFQPGNSNNAYMKNVYNAGNVSANTKFSAGIVATNINIQADMYNVVNAGDISVGYDENQNSGAGGITCRINTRLTMDNVYSLGNVTVPNPHPSWYDKRAYAIGSDISRGAFNDVYYKSGIAPNIAENAASLEISEINCNDKAALTLEVVNNDKVFKADTSNVNKGYPIFIWQ